MSDQNINSFYIGQRVRVSDGEKEPPARFNRKLESWKDRNYSGRVEEIEEPRQFQPNGALVLSRDEYPDGMGGVSQFRFQVMLGGRLSVTSAGAVTSAQRTAAT